MKLATWNVNGIRAITRKNFWEWLDAEQPDVLCLQETKAHPGQLEAELVRPPGYRADYRAAQKKGYSGVSTWIREPLAAGISDENVQSLGVKKFDNEGRVLRTDFAEFTLLNCYFPNSQHELGRLDYKLDFCRALRRNTNELRAAGRPVVVCGDFNIAHRDVDLARPKDNVGNPGFHPKECAWMTRFLNAGFVDVFRRDEPAEGHYTWWTFRAGARQRNIGWRIDYWVVSEDFGSAAKGSSIQPDVQGSDHCPVLLELDL